MSDQRFHMKTGSMITLSNCNKQAQRISPRQEFNNGIVLSSEPLKDDEIFEVTIDRKVAFWSGSIEIGVVSLDPSVLESSTPFPSSAGNMEGSWVMSGTTILNNGKVVCDEYGAMDLDQLCEGWQVGVMVSSMGHLHFFINGCDQGPVASYVMKRPCYGLVDLYGKCAQVSIFDRKNSRLRLNGGIPAPVVVDADSDSLKFHERCGKMVRIFNDNLSAERRKPVDEFNNGVVMTHRPLRDNERFEIRIEELVHKWSGSIEMGITTHSPEVLVFPATMTNMRSGTIMMSGCGILTNGKGSKREYGDFNLDELREGDRIGLLRKPNGDLHYYINGMDQGVASSSVPDLIYGVVDLYGMTVKVTIHDATKQRPTELFEGAVGDSSNPQAIVNSHEEIINHVETPERLLFHSRCGDHVRVINQKQTAIRPNCMDEFNKAVVLTNRPLLPGELFQVLLQQVVTKWAGSIEIGVTTHKPQDLDFPSTMTNVRSGTWMLTGNGVMYNGTTIIDEYGHNLDKVKAGDTVGVLVTKHGALHFYVNGVDQGVAAGNVPSGAYGVVDLYGQAVKASIVHNSSSYPSEENNPSYTSSEHFSGDNHERNQSTGAIPRRPKHLGKQEVDRMNESSKTETPKEPSSQEDNSQATPSKNSPVSQMLSFHLICSKNVVLKGNNNQANRISDYKEALVFSSKPLESKGYFEVEVLTVNKEWQGSLIMGLTDHVPTCKDLLPELSLKFKNNRTWLLFGTDFYVNGVISKHRYAHQFWRLSIGDRVAVKVDSNRSLHFVINGTDLGVAAVNLPLNLYVVCDLFGSTESISILQCNLPPAPIQDFHLTSKEPLCFHKNHGRNVELLNSNKSARRVASYNQGLVMTNRSLKPDELFEIKIDSLNAKWTSSIRIGVTNQCPDDLCLPLSAHAMRINTWIISADGVVQNGRKICTKYGCNLDSLLPNQLFGVLVDSKGKLHLFVNGEDEGVAASEILFPCWGLVDLYGQCTQVSYAGVKSMDENDLENKEKGDSEIDIKENLCQSVVPQNLLKLRNCKFKNILYRIKEFLFPDFFFLPEQDACFCDMCHKLRGGDSYLKKGDPPQDYAEPFGWCRFGLKSRKLDKNVTENWHVAFHGTNVGYVRQILDHQGLLPLEELGLQCYKPPTTPSEANVSSHIMISPTICYAGDLKFAPKYTMNDPETKEKVSFQSAFQIFIRPGSYSVLPQKKTETENEKSIDSHFSNNNLEWYTKEDGSTVLHGLLMKLVDT